MTCGVYASGWIVDRVKGTDEVFARAKRAKDLSRPVVYFAGKCDVTVADRYRMDSPVKMDDGTNRVVVTVCDYEPTPAYRQAAEETKTRWGNMGVDIIRNARNYLKAEANLVSDDDRSDDASFDFSEKDSESDERESLFHYFRAPGFKLWTLMSTSNGGHLMATYGEDDKFWIFDSLRGEASVPHTYLESWFNSDLVKAYLAAYRSFTALDLSRG